MTSAQSSTYYRLGIMQTMENRGSEKFKYYRLPEEKAIRVNLDREKFPYPKTTNHFEIEKPNGKLEINFYSPQTPLPEEISCQKGENLWILIANGNGIITKSSQDLTINNVPAVFFLQEADTIKTQGEFSAWIVRLKETAPTLNLPTGNAAISERILTADQL